MILHQDNQGYDVQILKDAENIFQGKIISMQDGWNFHMTNTAELVPWWLSYWKMAPLKGNITGNINQSLQLQGAYNFNIESSKLQSQAQVQGSFSCSKDELSLQGKFLDDSYECLIDLHPSPHIVQLRHFNEIETFIDFHEHEDASQGTVGYVGFNFIK